MPYRMGARLAGLAAVLTLPLWSVPGAARPEGMMVHLCGSDRMIAIPLHRKKTDERRSCTFACHAMTQRRRQQGAA